MPVRLLRRLTGTACGRPSGRWLAHKGVPLPQTPTLPQTRFTQEDDATRKRRRPPPFHRPPETTTRKSKNAPPLENNKGRPQHRGAAFFAHLETPKNLTPTCVGKTRAAGRDDGHPEKHPHVRGEYHPSPAHFPLRLPSGRASPSALAADAAMARARRRSRTPAGRTERRSRRGHHPAPEYFQFETLRASTHTSCTTENALKNKGKGCSPPCPRHAPGIADSKILHLIKDYNFLG